MSQNFKINKTVTDKVREGKRNLREQHKSMSNK